MSTPGGAARDDGTDRARPRPAPPARDAAHPPLRGALRRSSTARRRSAASCTSTSARRPSPSGAMQALGQDDAVVATYREHGHALVRGVPAARGDGRDVRQGEGCSGGRGGSMHLFDAARRFYGGNAIVAGGLPLAVGLALADKMTGRSRVDRLLLRRGRDGRGRVPRVDEPRRAVAAARSVLLREQPLRDGHGARALGVRDRPGPEGGRLRDARVVGRRDGRPRRRGRRRGARRWRCAGARPCFLELRTYRFRAHSMYDPDLYRSKDEIERWTLRDPIALLEAELRQRALLDDAELERIEQEVAAEIDDAVAFAEAGDARAGRGPRALRVRRAGGALMTATATTTTTYPPGAGRRHRRRDAPRRARVPHGRGRRALRRVLRRQPRPARRVRPRAHPRHAAVGVGASSARASAPRWAACGRSSR